MSDLLEISPIRQGVVAAFRDSPFATPGDYRSVSVRPGLSISDIIEEIAEDWQKPYVRVILNDEVVAQEDWPLTVPKQGDVLNIVLVPQSGDVGNIFKAVAIIAITIAASVLLGPEVAGFLGVKEAAGIAAVSAGVGAASGLAASLALNALFPPPVPGLPSTGTSGTSEDPVYGFSRSGNQINKYAAIPRIYGCRKVFPQHAIAPYIIAQGSDQYLYQAFTAGYGPLKIEDIRIGDNPIGNYKDVEYYIHEGFVAGDELKIVKNDNWQDPYSIKLVRNVDNIVTTTDDAQKATLSIQFPQGLLVIDRTNGNRLVGIVYFEIKARPYGTSTWHPFTDYAPIVTDAVIDATVTANSWVAVGSAYTTDPTHLTVTELPDSSSVANGEYRTLVTTEWSDEYGNASYSYQDYQNNYTTAATSQIKVEKTTSRPFFVNVNLAFPSAGKWEFKVVRKSAFTNNGSLLDISDWTPDDQAYTDSYISSVRSVKELPPIAPDKPISLIELKIKATDQLNGAVSNLSCIVTSILPVWNGSSWTSTPTRNPAWAYLDVMRGTAAKRALPDSRIDLPSFLEWANWCDETQPNFVFTPASTPNTATTVGYVTSLYHTILFREPESAGLAFWVNAIDSHAATREQVRQLILQSQEASAINRARCDLEVTSQTTAWEILKLIAATGYATPSQKSGKYSIAIDRPQDTAAQLFTPKNIKSFSGNMTYHIQPHALRISYTKTNETDTDEIIVYDDGYNADGSGGKQQATIFETMKLVGITRYNQAYTTGRRALAQGKLRIEKFTISCDVEHLLATRGSLVRLSHDVPMIGSGSGRVVSVSGSAITIDEDFKITSGSIYANVRHLNGSQGTGTLSAISGATATISGVSAAEGDLIVYGLSNRVVTDCLVKSVKARQEDLTATLELVPYAPAIYTAETEAIPDRDPFISGWTGGGTGGGTNTGNQLTPGLVTSLLGTYQITYDNKTPRITVDLSWGPPVTGGISAKYKVWYQDTAGWRLLGETVELTYKAFNEYTFTDADGNFIDLNGKALVFAVAGIGSDGSSLNPDYAKQVTVTPSVSAPKEIEALYATAHYMANEISWTFTDDPFDTKSVEIWASTTNSRTSASLIAKVDVPLNSYVHTGIDSENTWYYWAKASDGNGNFSAWVPNTTTSTVNARALAVESQYIDISGFTGFRKSAGGAYTPTNATLTAIVTGISNPTYSWSVNGASTGETNASTVNITPNNSDTKITVTLTVNGDNLVAAKTKTIIMPINIDGAAGEAGSNGVMSSFPTIYRWTINSTPPARPTTTSTYTWGTGAFTAPTGWDTYAPNNTTAGSYLWSITIPLNTVATTSTSTLDWTNVSYPIRAIAYNGTNGTAGQGQVKGICFLRATSAPATPSGGTYLSPTATGWSDGIPSGTNPLYMTTRIFTSDGQSPQQATWTTPQLTSSLGQGVKTQFSTDASSWHDTPATTDVYMRTGTSTDGGATWTYAGAVKIKGEVGSPGIDGANGSNGSATFVITRSANDSSAPTITEVNAAISRSPVPGDICTVSYNNYNNAVVYRFVTSWTLFTTYITGSLIVQNTITADRLVSKTITAASGVIDDAAVNTLQIAGNAVTVPSFFQQPGEIFNIGTSYSPIVTGTATVTGLQPLVITYTSGIGGGSDNSNLNTIGVDCNIAVYVETTGGLVIAYKEVNVGVTIDPTLMRMLSGSCTFTAAQVPSGTYNFRVKAKCLQTLNGTTVKGLFARYPSFTLLETKR